MHFRSRERNDHRQSAVSTDLCTVVEVTDDSRPLRRAAFYMEISNNDLGQFYHTERPHLRTARCAHAVSPTGLSIGYWFSVNRATSTYVILIVILIIIGIPSSTHSFTLGFNPSFSANPPYRSLSFSSFRIHYMDFPDCLLLFLSMSVFYFLVFLFSTF